MSTPARDDRGRFASTPPPGPPRRSVSLTVLLAAIVAFFLAGGLVGLVVDQSDDGQGHKRTEVTFKVDSADKDRAPDKTLTLDGTAQRVLAEQKADAAAGDTSGAEAKLHEQSLPPVTVQAQAHKLQPDGQPKVPAKVPLAAASEPGCT